MIFIFSGLRPFLNSMKDQIMTTLQDLQTKTDELVAKVEEANGKTDALILAASTTKDALVALQQAAAAGTTVTSADLQAVIDKQQAAIDSLAAQEVQTDAASAAVVP